MDERRKGKDGLWHGEVCNLNVIIKTCVMTRKIVCKGMHALRIGNYKC